MVVVEKFGGFRDFVVNVVGGLDGTVVSGELGKQL